MRTDVNRSCMHVVMPPMDKSTFYTRNCMINVESLAAKTYRWEVLQCPAVPKAERIVESPFVQVEVQSLTLMAMLLTSSRHPSSLPGRLPSVVQGSSSRWAAVGWCYSVLFWYWQSLSLTSMLSCSLSTGAVLSWLLICWTSCSIAARELSHCSYVIPQFMFESAYKCYISCLWFCLCNLREEFQLVAPRAYQFLSVYPPRYFLPSVLMLILVPPKTSCAFSSPVAFMTSHDFEAIGLHPNLGPFKTF